MLNRTFRISLFVTTALIGGACDTEGTLEQEELELIIEGSSGPVDPSTGDEGGEGGSDESGGEDEVFDEFEGGGEGQVCEPVVVEQFNFVREEAVDDLAAPVDPALGQVACPWTAGITAKYVDYNCKEVWNGTAELNCEYACDCSVKYESPCNPPHADCGAGWNDKEAFQAYIGDSPLGTWQCHLQGAIQCRLKLKEYGLTGCQAWCESALPKRKLECPGCK